MSPYFITSTKNTEHEPFKQQTCFFTQKVPKNILHHKNIPKNRGKTPKSTVMKQLK